MIALTDLQYVDPDNTIIDMTVSGWFDEAIPFTYHPGDTADLTLVVWQMLSNNNYTIRPYTVPVPPQVVVVTPRQIRLALTQLGLRTAVEAYIAAASQDVKDSWDYSMQFEIDHPLIVACMAALGKTEDDLKALFNLAGTL